MQKGVARRLTQGRQGVDAFQGVNQQGDVRQRQIGTQSFVDLRDEEQYR